MSGAFVCKGSPGYQWLETLKKLEPIDYDNFLRRAPAAREHLPDTHAGLSTAKSLWLHELIMDGDELQAWSDVGVEVSTSRIKGLASNAQTLQQTIYQISVANVGLLSVTRVEVLEDVCTNELQGWLDLGWRIVAVCPPNDTRRPTYIMGHTDVRAKTH